MLKDMDHIFAFLTLSLTVKLISMYINKGKNVEHVGKISQIIIYPVKAAKGEKLENAECLQRGLKYTGQKVFDRNFVVVNSEGRAVMASNEPKVCTIGCKIENDNLILEADGMTPLKIPASAKTDLTKAKMIKVLGEEVEGQDCGEEVAQWISKVFGKDGFRLHYGADNLKQRHMNQQKDKWKKEAKDGDIITFQNGFPIMLASQSSLDELNSRLQDSMCMERFRPNLVISGSKAFDEDTWRELWIGNMKFTQLKPCNRCPTTLVNPANGVKNDNEEPLKTLRTFRLAKQHFGISPLFGVNLVLDSQDDVIKIGDPVYILRGKII